MPHPDYLCGVLHWAQFTGWQAYWRQEPWGEWRADMRSAANSIWQQGATEGTESPNLMWPYFESPESMWAKHEALEARAKGMTPELAAKLKEARQRHVSTN